MKTDNDLMVAVQGDFIRIMALSPRAIKKEQALWIVALVDRDGEFEKVLEAVQGT